MQTSITKGKDRMLGKQVRKILILSQFGLVKRGVHEDVEPTGRVGVIEANKWGKQHHWDPEIEGSVYQMNWEVAKITGLQQTNNVPVGETAEGIKGQKVQYLS